jgi:hypothetical protein
MLVFVENQLQEGQIPEIYESEEDKSLATNVLKQEIKKHIGHFFRPNIYINKNTGYKIAVTSRLVNEWYKKIRRRELALAILLLDDMLVNSILIRTVPDNKKTPSIESVSYFKYQCKINGNPYNIGITVKKHETEGHFAYYYGYLRNISIIE